MRSEIGEGLIDRPSRNGAAAHANRNTECRNLRGNVTAIRFFYVTAVHFLSLLCADTPTTPPAIDFADGAVASTRDRTAGNYFAAGYALNFESAYVRQTTSTVLDPHSSTTAADAHTVQEYGHRQPMALFTPRRDPGCH